jgi:hypothetical protein
VRAGLRPSRFILSFLALIIPTTLMGGPCRSSKIPRLSFRRVIHTVPYHQYAQRSHGAFSRAFRAHVLG